MVSLEFLAEQDERAIRVTSTGRTALGSEEKFNLKAQSAVRSYLANCGVPIDRILRVISQIQLPDVPDAETIHSALYAGAGETPQTLSKEQLRSLLFFYAMAGGMTRCVRVFYGAAQ
ncbi:MAG: hypothetical protein IT379_30375 [Deltaproteobacteria bacterium]|nr:hypothetical protein [Deltaproteobacteria bacterium]